MLCVLAPVGGASAQNAPQPLKEIQLAGDAYSLGDPVPLWVEPVAIPETAETKPLVVRLADTQWRVADTPIVYVHRAVMINDVASLNAGGQLAIPFIPQYQRLQLHFVHVLRGGESLDRTTSSTIRFLQRETGLERGVYSGVVTVSILVNDLRVGDTVDMAYSLSGQNPVFGGKFIGEAPWDQGLPTVLRSVALTYPATRKINWRLVGDAPSKPLLTPRESSRDGMRTLRFEERGIREVIPDRLTPPDYVAFRTLQFSEFSGWDDVVSWADDLFKTDGPIDDEVAAVVAKLRERPTTEQRVVAALEFVQSEIRYFSVALGESSHRPTQPNVVLQRRYGDCKDKSFLLITLLRELGVHSEPVLLNNVRRKGLDKWLPSPHVFDHAIVRADVDGKVFYLDPTRLGQHGRLDRMGQSHEGAQVLVIAPGVRELSTIKTANAFDLGRSERTEVATLSQLGPAGSLETRQTWHGVGAESLRIVHAHAQAQFDKITSDAIAARYPGAKLTQAPRFEDDQVNNVISVTAVYDVPKLATELDGNWIVRFVPVNLRGGVIDDPSSSRTAPLWLPAYPFEGRYSFEARFPNQVSVLNDPQSMSAESKQFSFSATVSFRGNVSRTVIDLKVLADRVEVPDLQKYSDDLHRAFNLVKPFVLVTKDAIKSSTAVDSKDFAQVLRARQQDRIDKITETIKSGKLTGSDLANAYCERAASYNVLDQIDDAMRDGSEALKLAPNNAHIIGCQAEAYFRKGDYDTSIANYSEAITLDPANSEYFWQRGISRFYAGKLDDAAADFAKASAMADIKTQAYVDLWLAFTFERLGKQLPEEVAKRAADPHADWPRPALAMLAGNITPDQMLATLDNKAGDDRTMALAEAYFYLGQHALILGDKAKARALFEKTRQMGVIIFTEHMAAKIELAHLDGKSAASWQ